MTEVDVGMTKTSNTACRCCGATVSTDPLVLSAIPVANRFVAEGPTALFELAMAQCPICGLIQLLRGPHRDAITPTVSWITYNEPEQHLDDVVGQIVALIGEDKPWTVGVVTPFENALVSRFNAAGVPAVSMDLLSDLPPAAGRYPYLETIQARLSHFADLFPRQTVVVLRYLLEHCENPVDDLVALSNAVTEDGLVVIEVPDSTKFLTRKDYSFLWEEHLCYFTPDSLRAVVGQAGLEIIKLIVYPGHLEDALVAVCRKASQIAVFPPVDGRLFDHYRQSFAILREAWHRRIDTLRRHGKVALLGAGHQSVMFINSFGLNDKIDMVVDDNPHKQGLSLPGLRGTIVASTEFLEDTTVKTLLLAVNPAIHSKIKDKLSRFGSRNGVYYSIFPTGAGDTPLETLRPGVRQQSPEVFVCTDDIISISTGDIDFLKVMLQFTAKKRVRLNLHLGPQDGLHQMIIALDRATYVRPHKHIGKSESFHILEGCVDVVVFGGGGAIKDVIRLSAYGKGDKSIYRMSSSDYHTLRIRSAVLVMHEITNGPFTSSSSLYADFSPDDSDAQGVQAYVEALERQITRFEGTAP